MAKASLWRRWLNLSSGPRRAVQRCRLCPEELEPRLAPATVQFSAASETINETAGTFSITATVSGAPQQTTFASGFSNPQGLAFDTAGNLYVANYDAGTISKVTPAGQVSTFASGLSHPDGGLAFDAAGNLYVANFGNNTISKVTPAGQVSTYLLNISNPAALAFDAAGNLYVANENDTGQPQTVTKVTPSGQTSLFASGALFTFPEGLAFDAAGNLYVANGGAPLGQSSTVCMVTPAGQVSTFASGFTQPAGLAFDAAGNLYVANAGANTVSEVTPAGVVTTFASGFNEPVGLAFDAAGNLYVANAGGNTVTEVLRSVSVPFTLGGTAKSGIDYSGVTASPLVIAAGQTSATITGTLLSDPGPSQTLTFTLGTPSGASLGSPSVNTLTIDEPAVPPPPPTAPPATPANSNTLTIEELNAILNLIHVSQIWAQGTGSSLINPNVVNFFAQELDQLDLLHYLGLLTDTAWEIDRLLVYQQLVENMPRLSGAHDRATLDNLDVLLFGAKPSSSPGQVSRPTEMALQSPGGSVESVLIAQIDGQINEIAKPLGP